MKRGYQYQGEDFRWNLDRPVGHDDFNVMNDVGIFQGPLEGMRPEIGGEELKALLEGGGEAVLVDVRERHSYEEEHICGAVNIPVDEIEALAPPLIGKDALIIVYGSGTGGAESAVAADKLATIAYRNVLRFKGGMEEWRGAGYCLEGVAGWFREAA